MFFKILIAAIFKNICNFFKFLIIFDFFYHFFRHQGPRDLQVLMISWCIVSIVNGMVINILMTPALAIFDIFFLIFGKLLFQVFGSL